MNIGYRNYCYSNLPDPVPEAEEVLLEVFIYLAIRPNNAGSIVYSKGASGLQKVLNYASVYRWSDVYRKVLSRQVNEQVRNDKWLVCGIGSSSDGEYFYFVHPFAQQFQSKVAVPKAWLAKATSNYVEGAQWASLNINETTIPAICQLAAQLPPIAGGGTPVVEGLMEEVRQLVENSRQAMQPVDAVFAEKRSMLIKNTSPTSSQAGAVLFGYGNYARTIAVPYMHPHVVLQKVHEVDPSLLVNCSLPSSANPLPDKGDENFDTWLIAGFHHTHAGLAVQALEHNVIPVIEKPIGTTHAQLARLEHVAKQSSTPFFQCFQKRYQIFNDFMADDFQLSQGQPVHYKAVVYEIPLHRQHWYNWPVSGSRIISNGCHWIDQFMFLNNYAACVHAEARRLNKDELLLMLKLDNGASGVITLSDIGANRIGMREYVELSVPGRRITITDSMWYKSETDHKILRKASTDKLHYLRRMYRHIGQAVVAKSAGDALESLRSSFVAIALDEQFRAL